MPDYDLIGFSTERLVVSLCDTTAGAEISEIVSFPEVSQSYCIGRASERLDIRAAEAWRHNVDDWQRLRRLSLAVRSRDCKTVIGFVRIDRGFISYLVNPIFWRQGYGSEMVEACCNHLRKEQCFHVLRATVVRENTASKRILEKHGFSFTGLTYQPGLIRQVASRATLRYELGI